MCRMVILFFLCVFRESSDLKKLSKLESFWMTLMVGEHNVGLSNEFESTTCAETEVLKHKIQKTKK